MTITKEQLEQIEKLHNISKDEVKKEFASIFGAYVWKANCGTGNRCDDYYITVDNKRKQFPMFCSTKKNKEMNEWYIASISNMTEGDGNYNNYKRKDFSEHFVLLKW